MRNRPWSLLPLALVAASCASATGCSSKEPKSEDLAESLENETGVKWTIHEDERSNEVRLISPVSPVAIEGGSFEEKARGLFQRNAKALHAAEGDLAAPETTISDDGTTLRFEHRVPGTEIPVFDVATIASFTTDGKLIAAQPGFREDVSSLDPSGTVDRVTAEGAAKAEVIAQCGATEDGIVVREARLGARAIEGEAAALVWRVRFSNIGGEGSCIEPEIDLDAKTGAAIDLHERAEAVTDRAGGVHNHQLGDVRDIKTIDVEPRLFGAIHALKTTGPSPKVTTKRWNRLVNQEITTLTLGSWDMNAPAHARGAAVDGHYYGTQALRYFKEVHKRSGLDNKSSDISVVVHDNTLDNGQNAFSVDVGIFFTNDEMHIGDGDGKDMFPLSAGYDVLVHELTHGVVRHTSNLVYQRESGALNESFCDVMAASAEFWLGESKKVTDNMKIGERLRRTGIPFRDMIDPPSISKRYPDHYKTRNNDCKAGDKPDHKKNDNCNVHTNSSIGNRAFSLMTLGGTHKTSKISVAKGIGFDLASKIWFESMTSLRPQAGFFEAALVQVTRAALKGPDAAQAVGCAWMAVGVLDLHPDLAARNISCPKAAEEPKGASCAGRKAAFVCSDVSPFTAYVCVDGQISTAAFCSSVTQRCKKKAADDWTASVAENGSLICE